MKTRVVLKPNKLLSNYVVVSSNFLSFRKPLGPNEVFLANLKQCNYNTFLTLLLYRQLNDNDLTELQEGLFDGLRALKRL